LIGPAFLALTIVIAVSPVQGWLLRKGLPRWLSVLALLVGVYAVLSAIGLVMLVSILRLGGLVPQYQKQADAVLASVTHQLARFNVGTDQLQAAAKSLDWGKVAGLVEALLSGIAGLAPNLVFLVALLLFLCVEASGTGARMASIAGDRPQVAGRARRLRPRYTEIPGGVDDLRVDRRRAGQRGSGDHGGPVGDHVGDCCRSSPTTSRTSAS
jgi:AI-2 transport protein TqsA